MSGRNSVAHIDPYTLGDSAAGIALAAHRGNGGIDLNVRTCRANSWRPWAPWRRRIVVVHWAEWWKHGYAPLPGTRVPRRKIERLRLRQVRNLRSVRGHHRILTAEDALVHCRHYGVVPCFELKPSIWPARVLERLHAFATHRGWPVVAMTIQAYGQTPRQRERWEDKAYTRMSKAHDAGLHTMLLYRHPVDWERWAPVLTAVKGHRGHGHVVDVHTLLDQLRAGVKP